MPLVGLLLGSRAAFLVVLVCSWPFAVFWLMAFQGPFLALQAHKAPGLYLPGFQCRGPIESAGRNSKTPSSLLHPLSYLVSFGHHRRSFHRSCVRRVAMASVASWPED